MRDSLPVTNTYGEPLSECAEDMAAGLNIYGWPGRPLEVRTVRRGGVVVIPCPECSMAGQPHFLEVRMVNGKFVVTADT